MTIENQVADHERRLVGVEKDTETHKVLLLGNPEVPGSLGMKGVQDQMQKDFSEINANFKKGLWILFGIFLTNLFVQVYGLFF